MVNLAVSWEFTSDNHHSGVFNPRGRDVTSRGYCIYHTALVGTQFLETPMAVTLHKQHITKFQLSGGNPDSNICSIGSSYNTGYVPVLFFFYCNMNMTNKSQISNSQLAIWETVQLQLYCVLQLAVHPPCFQENIIKQSEYHISFP